MKKLLSLSITCALLSANIAFAEVPESIEDSQQFVVYWAGWGQQSYQLNDLPKHVTAINMAFADIDMSGAEYRLDTRVSENFLEKPEANGFVVMANYANWTQYKLAHPNTKMLVSIGGATFGHVWEQLPNFSDNDLHQLAKSIAAKINDQYPVYQESGWWQPNNKLIGYAKIDGVDLDVEHDSRFTSAENQQVAILIDYLHQELQQDKIITVTPLSVAADTETACTVPGSQHCGEIRPLLMSDAMRHVAWVNIMAYDAGIEYAESHYQTAMHNYATFINPKQLVLGLGAHQQWPGFTESLDALAAKTAWQQQVGFGGIMFWAVAPEISIDMHAYLDKLEQTLVTHRQQ